MTDKRREELLFLWEAETNEDCALAGTEHCEKEEFYHGSEE